MTTLDHGAVAAPRTSAVKRPPRLLQVARMHTVAWPLAIGYPPAILLLTFLIAITIFALIPDTGQTNFTGGVFSIYAFGIGFFLQAMTQTFPFALGLSVTRREYYRATVLVAGLQSVVFGTSIYLLSLVESATDGWGVRMRMFGIARYVTDNPVQQWLSYIVLFALVDTLGMFVGTLYLRWKTTGMFGLLIGMVAIFGGLSVLATWQKWWPSIVDGVSDTPRFVTLLLIPAVVAAAATIAGWLTLRRTTP